MLSKFSDQFSGNILNLLLDSVINGIFITESNGNILWVNKAFTDITGYMPEEVIGQNPTILKS